ncbi:TPA: hypothetical protein L5F01_005811 [Pseudomonas aeruginosa]|uniref:hypothetical protein n=1 Tax=Pseudomonas aeruginosa TaxID=287 RepID=UPI000A4C656E|nr:hypothetical protein [Pseudomonas aeruginosa]EKV3024681.1 hypothetical protein [Pseudomonas aeruginosa]EKV3025615.1 hypothetical protein [Pseudomonas aeruginosa]MBG4635320.1 hypothetical protein [Pseudomonas aeruginosa]MBG5041643.1 hypothetical protein [Pseudomonas aeruginosa]MCS7553747.1 hypothetical protein [Pseudomonas aeruginosa]
MALECTLHENSISLIYAGYTDNHHTVCSEEDQKLSFQIETPFNLNDEFKDKDFEIHFLLKKEVRENDIFLALLKTETDEKRIGWIIPINALESSLHSFAENPHFQRYAYKAIELTLKSSFLEKYTIKPDISGVEHLKLSNFLHPDTVLLVISKETLGGKSLELGRTIPSLMKYGFFPLTSKNPDTATFEAKRPEENKVKLLNISSDIENYQVISSIMGEVFPYETTPAFAFFYIYQIFELLLENILRHEQETVIDKLFASKKDPSTTKDILREMQTLSSEKERIKLLINQYCRCPSSLADLKTQCDTFLNGVGKKTGTNFEDFFYPVRNFIFHQFRDLPPQFQINLSSINSSTIELLPELLFKFKKPSINVQVALPEDTEAITPEPAQNPV